MNSCFITRRKRIRLYPSIPENTIAVKENRDSGFTFFFESTDIEKTLKDFDKKNEPYNRVILRLLDSVQKRNGIIYETTIRDSIRWYVVNASRAITHFKEILIPRGKMYLTRFDFSDVPIMERQIKKGSFTTKVEARRRYKIGGKVYYGKKGRRVRYKTKQFIDKKTGKIILEETHFSHE